jgi:electron-transferring-flavoprotein dehydrogenase
MGSPLSTKVTDSQVLYLSKTSSYSIPSVLTPWKLDENNYIISLSSFCLWLSKIAKSFNIQIFESFTAKDLIFNSFGGIEGVITGEVGLNPDGSKSEKYQEALHLVSKYVLLAEGTHGKLTEKVKNKYKLLGYHNIQYESQLQTYSLGLKEVWKSNSISPGKAIQTFGWPLGKSRGRGFLFTEDGKVHVGLIAGLDYSSPYLDPHEEFQRLKSHKFYSDFLQGECLEFGAKIVEDGGFFSVPKLSVPGGLILGSAGGLNNPLTYQGAHLAMKSGIIAAEVIFEKWGEGSRDLNEFYLRYLNSWVFDELFKVRNMRQAFNHSWYFGIFYSWFNWESASRKSGSFIETSVRGDNFPASQNTFNVEKEKKIEYDRKDGKINVEKKDSRLRTGLLMTSQPSFIKVKKDKEFGPKLSFAKFDGLEEKLCPTGVFRYDEGKLLIDSSKCIVCGACGIKSVAEMIEDNLPEAGCGPVYKNG